MTDHIAALIGLDPDTAAGANAVQDELLPMVHRYRAAWQSARRRAAQYRAENAQIEGLQNGVHNYEQWLAEECRRTEALRAQVARIRTFLEDMATWCSPHGVAADYARRGLDALDGVDPLGLAGPTREELAEELDSADRYADMVNAPLRPETIAAIAERIKAGDLPVRKVRARVRDMGREPAVLAIPKEELEPLLALAEDPPTLTAEQLARLDQDGVNTTGCDCGHPGMGVAWHLGWCAWRKGQENHGLDSPASGSRR